MAKYVWKHKKHKVIRRLPIALAVTALLGSSLLPAGLSIAETITSSSDQEQVAQSEEAIVTEESAQESVEQSTIPPIVGSSSEEVEISQSSEELPPTQSSGEETPPETSSEGSVEWTGTITGLDLSYGATEIAVGDTFTISGEVLSEGGPVDPGVAFGYPEESIMTAQSWTGSSVIFLAVGEGTATITALPKAGGGKFKQTVTVNVNPSTQEVLPEVIEIYGNTSGYIGEEIQLSERILPEETTDKSVSWSSSDPSIASIDPVTGIVTGHILGEVVITATSNADSSVIESVVFFVIEENDIVTIEGETTISVGETTTLYTYDQNNFPVRATWITANNDIIEKHSADGYSVEITGLKAGTVDISASGINTGTTVSATITVTDKPVRPIEWLDTSKLLAEILTCGSLNYELYTPESWLVLQNQSNQSIDDLERANIQNDRLVNDYQDSLSRKLVIGKITQADVDASELALKVARLSLVQIGEENKQTLDTTELAKELLTSYKLMNDKTLYTKDSWAKFSKQLTKTEKDLENYLAQNNAHQANDKPLTQADVDASLKALKDARLALVKVDSKPTPSPTKPDGNGSNGAGANNDSGTNAGSSGNSTNGSGNSSNNDENAGKPVSTKHIINKSDGTDSANGKLPQAGERNFIMASLVGVEVLLVCGLVYLVKRRREMI